MVKPGSGGATINVGDSKKVPLGQGFCFIAGHRKIAVFRQRDGGLFATQNLCPHLGGSLADGLLGGGKVICPLHAHVFDLSTGKGPVEKECLEVYPIREKDGQLLVDLPVEEPEGTVQK